jgi:glutaminase
MMDFAYAFFSKGEKEPLYSLQSGSKVAHYVEVMQKKHKNEASN